LYELLIRGKERQKKKKKLIKMVEEKENGTAIIREVQLMFFA